MLNPSVGAVCPGCTPRRMTHCIRPRGGAFWPLAVPLVPYMRGNLQRKQRALADADTVVAVSSAVERTLRDRLEDRRRRPLRPFRIRWTRRRSGPRRSSRGHRTAVRMYSSPASWPPTRERPRCCQQPPISRCPWWWRAMVPRVRRWRCARGRPAGMSGFSVARAAGVAPVDASRHDAGLPVLLARALPRVLIEASALGCPIVAMQREGSVTSSCNGKTGLLARSADELRAHARRLQHDPALAARWVRRRGAAWTRSSIQT